MTEPFGQEPSRRASGDHREIVVVGSGQAGLAVGYFLKQQTRDYVILEAANAPAAAWRARWDSLKLFTPVRYDSLPGRIPRRARQLPGPRRRCRIPDRLRRVASPAGRGQ